jgi:hypothetical protein
MTDVRLLGKRRLLPARNHDDRLILGGTVAVPVTGHGAQQQDIVT